MRVDPIMTVDGEEIVRIGGRMRECKSWTKWSNASINPDPCRVLVACLRRKVGESSTERIRGNSGIRVNLAIGVTETPATRPRHAVGGLESLGQAPVTSGRRMPPAAALTLAFEPHPNHT